ncbi:proliferating cell nuclear antigen-like [Palaemon carinicauda]|uniref:proliferating cell nuclear antigen-like n=1 Tax=Palaemon carinicauda TaxID=392227 RepID=UPI0035B6462D
MFEARLVRSSILNKAINSIKELLNEATCVCTESGIQLQAIDTSHVSLVSLNLLAVGFDEYKCDRNLVMGINISVMSKILKCATDDDDVITIKAKDDADTIAFIFESRSQQKNSKYIKKLMNLDQEYLNIPDINHNCIIRMPSNEFSLVCRDLSQFGDSINIACINDCVKFSTAGVIGTANIKFTKTSSVDNKERAVEVEVQEPIKMTFSCRYLNFFTKATAFSLRVSLFVSLNMPMVVEYSIEGIGNIRYFLAPKIEEENNS